MTQLNNIWRYVAVLKGSIMANIAYSSNVYFMLVGNLVYVVVTYFLWKQIYVGHDVLRGMTFNEVFVYLTLASSILVLFKTYIDWQIARQILDGSITQDLIKPLDFQWRALAFSLGDIVFNGVIVTVPTLIMVVFVFHAVIPVGLNLLFVLPSILCAYLIAFSIDYVLGLSAFYTQSIWGITITKDVIVSVLSGALIPLPFFPDAIQRVLEVLPFRAIYAIPLQIVTSTTLQLADYVRLLGIQLGWVIVFILVSRWFFNRVTGVLMVNGG